MKVESTAYLKIRFDWLFSIYVVFVVADHRPLPLAARGRLLRGKAPKTLDPTKASSGL